MEEPRRMAPGRHSWRRCRLFLRCGKPLRWCERLRGREHQVQQLLNEVRQLTGLYPIPEFNRFQHGFSHIFAGGYAAGYYSYLWAEVLSADAFGRFEEEGIFNADTGRDFLRWILERGGSAEPMELFKGFRGREPSNEALLRHMGIAS